MDVELLREFFENCRRAGEILGTDAEFRSELEGAEKRLPPLRIGQRGQLQEWMGDYPEVEPAHRHVSHLYALYPGQDITLKSTPTRAAVAQCR
jgi:alpha-L-fucosidase 2